MSISGNKSASFISFITAAMYIISADAFISGHQIAVADFIKAHEGKKMEIHLDVGEDEALRLGLKGLAFEFLENEVGNKKVNNGFLPSLFKKSEGPLADAFKTTSRQQELRKISDPSYIDMNGTKRVEMLDGCWQLFYQPGSPAGSLVCKFNFPVKTKVRNGVSIPMSDVYITFNVFTDEGLNTLRKQKREATEEAFHYSDEKDEWMEKMRSASNVFEWASNYRKVLEATEKKHLVGEEYYTNVPEETDVFEIQDGMFLSKSGSVWTGNMFMGKLFMAKILGSAFVANLE